MNVEKRLLRIARTLDHFASKMVKNPNPKGRKKMVTEEYAQQWLAENKGQAEKPEPPKPTEKPKRKKLDELTPEELKQFDELHSKVWYDSKDENYPWRFQGIGFAKPQHVRRHLIDRVTRKKVPLK